MKNTIVTGSLIVFSDGFVWKRLSNEKAYKIWVSAENEDFELYKVRVDDESESLIESLEDLQLATDSEKQRMIKALKKSKNPKAKEYLKRFFGIEERTKYEFKPFDKVLAKYYEDDNWEASLFIRTITDDQDGETKYECLNGTVYVYCIPFEGNEYLLGTAENPEK